MKTIRYPVSTEKGIKLMETENKLIFVVDTSSTKADIKKEVESMFKVRVESVNTFINQGKKKAYVKISKETPAINVATQLGLI
ncbi:50S ribosomal protein L23 [Candidatus Woesearchaeota archaeon]|nr:50S ribosomal protein L23 [Candidatus Woesearchaeota archaeon]